MTAAQRRHAQVGPATLWRMKRAFQVRFLKTHGLEPSHRLLDLGCGTLRGGVPLIEYLEPGRYTGIDVRDEVIAQALEELAGSGLADRNPRMETVPDLAVANLGESYDLIWSFQTLIHMTDEILAEAAGFMARHLAEGGRAFATVRVGQVRDGSWRGFPAVTRPLAFYEKHFGAAGLSVSDVGPLTDFGHVLPGKTIEEQSNQRMLAIRRVG